MTRGHPDLELTLWVDRSLAAAAGHFLRTVGPRLRPEVAITRWIAVGEHAQPAQVEASELLSVRPWNGPWSQAIFHGASGGPEHPGAAAGWLIWGRTAARAANQAWLAAQCVKRIRPLPRIQRWLVGSGPDRTAGLVDWLAQFGSPPAQYLEFASVSSKVPKARATGAVRHVLPEPAAPVVASPVKLPQKSHWIVVPPTDLADPAALRESLQRMIWAFDILRYTGASVGLILLGAGAATPSLAEYATALNPEGDSILILPAGDDLGPGWIAQASQVWCTSPQLASLTWTAVTARPIPLLVLPTSLGSVNATDWGMPRNWTYQRLLPTPDPVELAKAAWAWLQEPPVREAHEGNPLTAEFSIDSVATVWRAALGIG